MKVLVNSKTSYLFKPIVDKILEEKLTVEETEEHSEDSEHNQSNKSSKPQSVNQVISIDELPENFSTDFEAFNQIFETEQIDCLIIDLMAINETKKLSNNDSISQSAKLANILSFLQRLELDRPVHLIGLSTVLTWNQSANQSKKFKALKEKQFKKRVCSAKYLQLKALEQSLLSNQSNESSLSIKIIARGLAYGAGESLLEPLFRAAWLLEPNNLPIVKSFSPTNSQSSPSNAAASTSTTPHSASADQSFNPSSEQSNETEQSTTDPTAQSTEPSIKPTSAHIDLPSNLIPMVHVLDHATFVFHELNQSINSTNHVEDEESEPKYLVAVDQSVNQSTLIKSIAGMLGHGADAVQVISQSDLDEQLNSPSVNQPIDSVLVPDSELVDWLTVDLQFEQSIEMKSIDQASNESGEPATDDQSIADSAHHSVYHSIKGFLVNQSVVKQEFIDQRSLKPIKIWVDGRPVTGKSRLAAHLANKLSIPHLSINSLIEEAKSRNDALSEVIRQTISRLMEEETERVNQLKAQQSNKKLSKKDLQKLEQSINQSISQSTNPRLPGSLLVDIVRQKVSSPICRNAGFVLDGFPRNLEEAKLLFDCEPAKQTVKQADNENKHSDEQSNEDAATKETDEAEQPHEETHDESNEQEDPSKEQANENEEQGPADDQSEVAEEDADQSSQSTNESKRNHLFFPLTIVSIQSTNQTVSLKYSQSLSYDQLIVGHNDPEGIARRWQRELEQSHIPTSDQQDNQPTGQIVPPFTYLNEVEPLVFSDEDLNNLDQVSQIVQFSINQSINRSKLIFNYHPTPAELKKIADVEQSIKNEKEFEKRLINQRKIAAEQARMSAKKEREQTITQSINKQEQERLEAASAPLRAYLIDNVLPAVIQGMTEVVTITQANKQSNNQPIDPIEYLSEFLYRYALNAPLKRPARQPQPGQPSSEEHTKQIITPRKEIEESKEQMSEQTHEMEAQD